MSALVSPVVGGEENVGVVDQLVARIALVVGFFEELHQLTDIVVERFHHGTVVGVFLPLQRPAIGIGWEIHAKLLAVFFQERLAAGLDRGVDEPSCVVEEEWLSFAGLHELQRGGGHRVGGETLGIEAVGILRLIGRKIFEAVFHAGLHPPGIEAAAVRGKVEPLIQRAGKREVVLGHVPFSGVPGGVAVLAENLGECEFVFRHAAAIPRRDQPIVFVCDRRFTTHDMGFLGTGGVVPAHDRTTTRRAGRRG